MVKPTTNIIIKDKIAESELVLNPDGSVYHLHLLPEHVADTIIVVGDQGRVERISRHFEQVECRIRNREFVTHTGTCNGHRITVLSTGIGSDNIDIVLNELDAAVNINLHTRTRKTDRKQLDIIRIGTSGSLQQDIPVDSFVISEYGLGLDGLIYYYQYEPDHDELALQQAFEEQVSWTDNLAKPYFVKASMPLFDKLCEDMTPGITATATGFYGPQGRILNIPTANPLINEQLQAFNYQGQRITNFEMETSALYSLGALLGHRCCTCCAIIANRAAKTYSDDYQMAVDQLIECVLAKITT